MSTERFRVVPSPFASPARVARARTYSRAEDAIAAMGEGIVLGDGGRLVAFHERHLRILATLDNGRRSAHTESVNQPSS